MKKLFLIALLAIVLPLVGCAGISGNVIKFDAQNAAETRKIAEQFLSTWRLNSGFIHGALGAKIQELPASVVLAMDELDKLALKQPPFDDYDLGYSLGVRVRILGALVTQALRQYAPEIFQALPGVLAL